MVGMSAIKNEGPKGRRGATARSPTAAYHETELIIANLDLLDEIGRERGEVER